MYRPNSADPDLAGRLDLLLLARVPHLRLRLPHLLHQ